MGRRERERDLAKESCRKAREEEEKESEVKEGHCCREACAEERQEYSQTETIE